MLEGIGLGGIIVLIANVYAIIKILGADSATTGSKVLWIILILLLPIVGFLIWFLFGPRD